MKLRENNINARPVGAFTYSHESCSTLDSSNKHRLSLLNNPLNEYSKSFHLSVNDLQMHQIRFPTPPTTPPKEIKISTYKIQAQQGLGQEQRTESVIMRVEDGISELVKMNKIKTNTSVDSVTLSSEFTCNWINCKRIFGSLATLASHVNKVHATASLTDGLYYCRWDGCPRMDRGFNARYKMLVHVRTHTKEKPHQCNLCEKCFSRAENLKIHIRSHSGEKPYICSFEGCQKAYSNSSDRFKHTRTHSMEKPYLCKVPGCQKRYTDPSSLRKHVKTFKHAQQLINANGNIANPEAAPTKECALGVVRKDSASEGYHTKCYIDVEPEEFCCLKANELNYYYFDNNSAAPSYWISDIQNNIVGYETQCHMDTTLEMNAELPLDLRINRIA